MSRPLCQPRRASSSFPKGRSPVSILKPDSLIFTFILYIFSSKVKVDVSKAVLIFLPIVFSKAGGSAAARDLLKAQAGHFSVDPRLRSRYPQENWDQLSSSSYKACELALTAEGDNPTIPDPEAEIGTSSRGSAFYTMLWSCVCLGRDSPS